MSFTIAGRLSISVTALLIWSLIYFTSVSGSGAGRSKRCGFENDDFKYFVTLESLSEGLDPGLIMNGNEPLELETYGVRTVTIHPASNNDDLYVSTIFDSDGQSLRFELLKPLGSFLATTNSSIMQYEIILHCIDSTEITTTLMLDVVDLNDLAPTFNYYEEDQKYFIVWEQYERDPVKCGKLNSPIEIHDGDYMPGNGNVSIVSCIIDEQFSCQESLMDLSLTRVKDGISTGYFYNLTLMLKNDVETVQEFIDENYPNNTLLNIKLTVSDGVNQNYTEFQLAFVGPTERVQRPESDGSGSQLPLPMILGISGGSALIIIILIVLLVGAAIRIRHKQQNIDQLTEADIREFREGTSFLSSTTSLDKPRDSISANAPILARPYNSQFEILRDQLKIDETTTLGSGVFGTVFKGYITVDGQKLPVAVKTVKRNAGVLYFKSLLTELKIMAFIGKHPNIVSLIGSCTQNIKKRELYVAVELCSNGSFRTYLKDRRDFFENMVDADGKLNFRRNSLQSMQNGTIFRNSCFQAITTIDLVRWAFQIANGMEFIASKKVIHGDLAARNILLDDNRVAKIADFGLSRRLIDYSQYNTYTKKSQCPLPWKYMAPESLKDLQFSLKTDIWTFGILLWEIFTLGQKPFSMHTWDEKFVTKLEAGLRLEPPKFAPKELRDLMKDCWAAKPNDRPTFYEIKRQISELLHTKGDYTELTEEGYYHYSTVSPPPSYYGVIRRQHIHERGTILPPKIVERPDDPFLY